MRVEKLLNILEKYYCPIFRYTSACIRIVYLEYGVINISILEMTPNFHFIT